MICFAVESQWSQVIVEHNLLWQVARSRCSRCLFLLIVSLISVANAFAFEWREIHWNSKRKKKKIKGYRTLWTGCCLVRSERINIIFKTFLGCWLCFSPFGFVSASFEAQSTTFFICKSFSASRLDLISLSLSLFSVSLAQQLLTSWVYSDFKTIYSFTFNNN